jgi:rhodanese-related sulfurtransferase
MNPRRIAAKFYVDPDPGADADVEVFIPIFHRFIQQSAVEGLLIDVADYRHVPHGPAVALIGHEVDYVIDFTGGRAGLLAVRKRIDDLSAGDALREILRMGLGAIAAIEEEGSSGFRFSTSAVEVQVFDRNAALNNDADFEALCREVRPVLAALFDDAGLEIARFEDDDFRQALGLLVTTPQAAAVATLLERLGRAPAARAETSAPSAPTAAPQSEWDISVEELRKLLDESAGFTLIDVREQNEYEICEIGGTLVPLGTVSNRLVEFKRETHIVVHCRSGVRSAKAVEIMRAAGFENVWNVHGGILAWIDRIDGSLTRY